MSILLGNEVVSSISKNIYNAIERGDISNVTEIATLYKDTPVQGMNTPCAFIESVSTEHVLEIQNYAMWHYIIDVRCHPNPKNMGGKGVQSWARQLAVKLLDCIDRITVSDQQVRAKSVEWRVEDGVLHLLSTYRFRVTKEKEEGPIMETLSQTSRTRRLDKGGL